MTVLQRGDPPSVSERKSSIGALSAAAFWSVAHVKRGVAVSAAVAAKEASFKKTRRELMGAPQGSEACPVTDAQAFRSVQSLTYHDSTQNAVEVK